MNQKIAIVLSFLAVVLATAGTSVAGTKWQTNLVPESALNPTILEKSKVAFKDKGQLKASLQGLTDAGGALVTTDESYKKNGVVNGDEYFVIVSGQFPALGVDFEFNLPIEAKAGKGSGKLDVAGLFTLIPAGTHRAAEMTSAKVVGPLGALSALDCSNNLVGGGFVVLGAPNPCDQGDLVGVGGVLIP